MGRPKKPGTVYLVGAGPGDPGLITVKGRECLEQADVVIYDYLANPQLLHYARPDAERIYVGKRTAQHTVDQTGINALIVTKAKQGRNVVRLKGGDPFVFGRGGEEAMELVENGIPFEIVPGVTSGIAAPAYAGIPLSMRGVNSTLAFVTGHEAEDKEMSHLDWTALSKMGTLVFYMGVKNLPWIAANLITAGKPEKTACCLIRWGTHPKQKVLQGTLADIAKKAEEARFRSPAIIVVGDVVGVRKKLLWFEKKPLFGRRVLITRAREQAGRLSKKLASLGAEVIEFPTIEIVPPESFKPLDAAIQNIAGYDTLILTSVNGVTAFFDRIRALRKDVRILSRLKVCAIGPATAKAIEERGILVDLMPEKYVAESVMETLRKEGVKGRKFLLARALVARDLIPDEIRAAGGVVDVVPVYRTVKPEGATEKLQVLVQEGPIDAVTFTSSSTVTNFFEALDDISCLKGTAFMSIGPVTSATLKKRGQKVAREAEEYTIDGLVDSIVSYFTKRSKTSAA